MSGKSQIRISLYIPRELLRLIDGCLPTDGITEPIGRSAWIRDACRQRLHAEAQAITEEETP